MRCLNAQASASCLDVRGAANRQVGQAALQHGRLQKKKGAFAPFSFPFPDKRYLLQVLVFDGMDGGNQPKLFVLVIMQVNGSNMVRFFQ